MRTRMKRIIKRGIDDTIRSKAIETADAVVWSIDTENNLARVKIAGSGKEVMAHFPRNWKEIPYYCKKGCVVRVIFRGGNKGYLEISGEGRAIPPPESGSSLPDASGQENMILTGCTISATNPESMSILIESGTYRIDGVVYTLNPPSSTVLVTMNDPPPMYMGSGTIMGQFTFSMELDAPPNKGYYRYDAFVVGKDGIIDYLKGTASKTEPGRPIVPIDHVLIGDYILVVGGSSVIYNKNIGQIWDQAYPARLEVTHVEYFEWNLYNNTPEINLILKVKDQYNNDISGYYTVLLEKVLGTGEVWSGSYGYNSSSVSQYFTSYQYTFKYRRDQLASEMSPLLHFTLNGTSLIQLVRIQLRDINGLDIP